MLVEPSTSTVVPEGTELGRGKVAGGVGDTASKLVVKVVAKVLEVARATTRAKTRAGVCFLLKIMMKMNGIPCYRIYPKSG
jgi:hypothetical protein